MNCTICGSGKIIVIIHHPAKQPIAYCAGCSQAWIGELEPPKGAIR